MTSWRLDWRKLLVMFLIYMCCFCQCSDGNENASVSVWSGVTLQDQQSLDSIYLLASNSSECATYQDHVVFNTTNEAVITSLNMKVPIGKIDLSFRLSFLKSLRISRQCLQSQVKDRYVTIMKNKYFSLASSSSAIIDDIKFDALSSCFKLIYDSNVHMDHAVLSLRHDRFWFLWFLFIDSCFPNKCSVTERLISQCSQEIDTIQENFSKDAYNQSFPISVEDIKYQLIPTLKWSCPNTEVMSSYDGRVLIHLWAQNKLLPQICKSLLCNGKTYSIPDIPAYFTAVNESAQFRNCSQYATRHSSFSDVMQMFSLAMSLKERIVFSVGTNDNMDVEHIRFLLLYHYANDGKFRRCCTHTPDYQFHMNDISFYLFCYGTSDSCKSAESLWFTEEVFENNYLITMREDVVQSKFFQFLVTLNFQISLSLYEYLISLNYEYTTFIKLKLLTFQVNINETEKLKMMISAMEAKGVSCNKTEHFTVCYKYSTYLMFLNNCSLNLPKDDKVLLLLINSILQIGLNEEYLCEKSSFVVRTSVQLTSRPENSSIHETYYIYQPCLNVGIGQVDNDLMVDSCKKELNKIEEQGMESLLYWNKIHFFSIFPLYLSENSAMRQSTLRRNSLDNTTIMNIISQKGPFKDYQFRISQSAMNIMDLPIMKDIEDNSKETLLSLQHTLRIFMTASLTNNTRCLRDLAKHRFSVHVDVSKQIQYIMGPISVDLIVSHCLFKLPDDIFHGLRDSFNRKMLTINKFWPTCSYNMLISWGGTNHTVVDWDYLSLYCKQLEIGLLCLSIIITMVTIMGNALTLIVLIFSGLVKKNVFMIHFSLAVADLLLGIMPAALAIHDHFSLMNGSLSLSDLDQSGAFSKFDSLMSHQALGFQQLRFERSGYPMVCSIVMNVSVYVSLLSLSLLSIERLQVVRGSPSGCRQLKLSVGLTWVLGITFSILINWRNSGWSFVGYFDPVTKLTINVGTGDASVSTISFYLQMTVAGIAGLIVIVLPVASILYYRYDEYKKQKILVIHDQLREEKLRHITLTFVYMVTLFVVASVPIVVDLLADLGNRNPVAHFFAWWFFMAGASWNWALYAFHGKNFREEASKVLCWVCVTVKSSLTPAYSGLSLEMT